MKKNSDRKFYIEDMIMARATESFKETLTGDNFQNWLVHWLAVAEVVKQEFLQEGLTTSAEYVSKFIEINREWEQRDKKQKALDPFLKAFVTEVKATGRFGGPACERYSKAKRELELA